MNEFNSFVLCPMLIDSPFQQEQDPTNRAAILDFIVSKKLPDQQMILATISVDEFTDSLELRNATIHELGDKLSVLKKDRYHAVLNAIGDMHVRGTGIVQLTRPFPSNQKLRPGR